MPNRPTIDVYERTNMRTGVMSYEVNVSDDYAYASLIFAEKMPDDDMLLLKEVIKAQDGHGTSSDEVRNIINYIQEHEIAVRIGETLYEWDEIKETMAYGFRNVYLCPNCGWESWDEDCYNCPNCKEGCEMQFSHEEEYEL